MKLTAQELLFKEFEIDLKAAYDKCMKTAKELQVEPELFVRSSISMFLYHANAVGIAAWMTTEPRQPMYEIQNWIVNANDRAWDAAMEKNGGTEDSSVAS